MDNNQHPRTDPPTPPATIRIVHTRADGTLIEGSRKGDGVWEVVRTRGFRASRNIGLYIRNSRYKAADRWKINTAADALRAAGFTVEVDIDDETPGPSFAAQEAERNTRAEDRAARYAERAERNTAAGEARWERTRERMSHIPLGQPVLDDHHSGPRHRRQIERARRQDEKAIEEIDKGQHWGRRADAAAHYQRHRENPGVTLRRLDKLQAERRRIASLLEDGSEHTYGPGEEFPADGVEVLVDYGDGYRHCRIWPRGDHKKRLDADLAQLDEEIQYWLGILAEAEARGVKLWNRADFAKGDFVIYHDTAVEVMRVNAKTLTVPWGHYWAAGGLPVATVDACKKAKQDGFPLRTDTLPYDKVQGRVTRAELEGLNAGQARALIARKIREAKGLPAEPDTEP